MSKIDFKYTIRLVENGYNSLISYNYSLLSSKFNQFNPFALGLGDISRIGEDRDALAVIFDLEGFTSFCNQRDPYLVIPEYLSKFLDWLFISISCELFQKKEGRHIILWCKLPFYAKFLGDGVLFLWDTKNLEPEMTGNIVSALHTICKKYKKEFLPIIKKDFSRVPSKLRCGIARGRISSIGEEEDYVGPCINVAARLQKLGPFSFAFAKGGFDPDKCFTEAVKKEFILIRSPIRGVGEEELIFVLRREFKTLPIKERRKLSP